MKKYTAKELIKPKKEADKEWYLSLLDEEEQFAYEKDHLAAVLRCLKILYIARYKRRIDELKAEADVIRKANDYSAEDYKFLIEKNAEISAETRKMNAYKCFFAEPYFARMDVVDSAEGYNSYYIGKKGDVGLEIVDWRAPLAVRYYQKSRVQFTINEYEYRTVLRRALSVKNGAVLDFKNEYLSVRDVLTPEEIAGRDEEILFDPYLRRILKERKEDTHIRDIIQTIQEKQFDAITRPERESFVLQGCAGSGKTMILLHRLSYLMYNNEKLRPESVLVITPSDSFNAFIDELAGVLELERVRTVTLKSYYAQVLKNEGIDLAAHAAAEREDPGYISYLYSPRFAEDVKKRIGKIFTDVYGLFTSEECRGLSEQILALCAARRESFGRIKNASTRVRRAVLGEMKESKEGGFYFTKPFRNLMGCFVQVEDFMNYVLREGVGTPDAFFRQFTEFYRCAQFVSAHGEQIFSAAREDLAALGEAVSREILDLKRYRTGRGEGGAYTYADRIARREELLEEIGKTDALIADMGGGCALMGEFFGVFRLTGYTAELGKCKGAIDVARWLYRETVKKYKKKFGMKGVYPSDGYAICAVLSAAGRKLSPRYGLVFIDEGQDISQSEYDLLKTINGDAAFNIFGDLKQNITPYRGVSGWDGLGMPVYSLDRNYRNTNEIVDYVSKILPVDMQPIGMHGEEVKRIPSARNVASFFRDKQGLKALIAREEYLPHLYRRGYHILSSDGRLSKTKINVMSVYESKGLEFSCVAVYDRGMSENERYIAYTRALSELAIVEK